jgi:UDP-2,3-diacylglucosamine hydrolase
VRQDWGTLDIPPTWRHIDFISDLHLQVASPATARRWLDYLGRADGDALFILGDLFEVWVGDDLLDAPQAPDADTRAQRRFLTECCEALRALSARMPLFVMHGNRDFLLGARFTAATGAALLQDPTCLHWNGRGTLLSHGDAWCLGDRDYLKFRAEVRSTVWQDRFLAQPLAQREAMARALRERSEALKVDPHRVWADVDDDEARRWLQRTGATRLIHGHTHRPGQHDLGQGWQRLVLSDWDIDGRPPRAEVLRLEGSGRWERIPLVQ